MSRLGSAPELPHVDEQAVEVAAPPQALWRALLAELPGDGWARRSAAAVLGCRERAASGRPDRPGATLVGFRVLRADPPARLALAGEHRLSRYALTFTIEGDEGHGRCVLRAATDAAFPGSRGRAYRALVVSSGMHRLVMRRLLDRIRRRAEDAA